VAVLALIAISWNLLSDETLQMRPPDTSDYESSAPEIAPMVPSADAVELGSSPVDEAKRRYDDAFARYTNMATSPATGGERDAALQEYRETYAHYLALKEAAAAAPAVAVVERELSPIPTPDGLAVRAYHPDSGAAGSQVLIELSSSIRASELSARYRDRMLPIRAVADRVIAVNTPVDLPTADIRLAWRDKVFAALPFTVKSPEVVLLHQQQLAPSDRGQTLISDSGVTVSLPAGLLKSASQLHISRIDNPSVEQQTPFSAMQVYDISISGLTQLDDFIEIGIPFDPAALDPEVPLEANFSPARWDEAGKQWVDLYFRVDGSSNTVYFVTDHLSSFWTGFSILGLGKTAAIVGVAGGAIGEVAERWANDKYLSKKAKIRILYSDEDLRKQFPDALWKRAIAPAALASSAEYDSKYAAAVQDIAQIFEDALTRYVDAGFPDPTVKGLFGAHLYTRYVKVKIDSLYNQSVQQGEMAHETFWDTIHVPSELIKLEFYDDVIDNRGRFEDAFATIKGHLAHELFHVVQRPHYPLSITFVETPHKWWREATAEWAGHDLAKIPGRNGWQDDPALLIERIGAGFLANPINSTGRIGGSSSLVGGLDYEYLASAFVRFLVRVRGLKIDQLIAQVAKDQNADPLVLLRRQLDGDSGNGFNDVYADFSIWLLQQSQMPLSDFAGNGGSFVAQRSDTVQLAPGQSRLRVEPTGAGSPTALKVQVFRTPAGREHLTARDRALQVIDLSQPAGLEVGAAEGDTLYFVAANGSARAETVGLAISTLSDGSWQRAAGASVQIKADGSAAIWAVRVAAGKSAGSRLVADFKAETDPTDNPLNFMAIAIERQGGLAVGRNGEREVSIQIAPTSGSLSNGYDTQRFSFSGATLTGSFTPATLDSRGESGSVSGSFTARSDTTDQRGNSTGIGYTVEVTGTFVAAAPGQLTIRFSGRYQYDFDDPDIADGNAKRSIAIGLKYP
jgi:hypothetical protein